jgi:hypothetical protein
LYGQHTIVHPFLDTGREEGKSGLDIKNHEYFSNREYPCATLGKKTRGWGRKTIPPPNLGVVVKSALPSVSPPSWVGVLEIPEVLFGCY